MKLIIKTKKHFGDRNLHRQGVQFEACFVHSPTDTADEYKAMHELSNIVKADCNDAGWGYYFGKFADIESRHGGRKSQCGNAPYTERERVLKARCVSAENLAKAYKRQMDAMRIVLVRNGLSVCIEGAANDS